MAVELCDGCGNEILKGKSMTWHNGIMRVVKHYCMKCVRNGTAPPIKQLKLNGGNVYSIDKKKS